jgi:reactive chlorine resistance protein C
MDRFNTLIKYAARLDRAGITATRIGLVGVLVWIGSLDIFHYEDEGIVPFVANSPLMSFFYREPAGEHRHRMNREGDLAPANRQRHERNGTYRFAYGLGSVIVACGAPIALNRWLPLVATVGGFLVFVMSLSALSFLITTPERWAPALGSSERGFALLSGAGRLVIKDAIMAGAALATMADSAKACLRMKVATTRAISQREAAFVGG